MSNPNAPAVAPAPEAATEGGAKAVQRLENMERDLLALAGNNFEDRQRVFHAMGRQRQNEMMRLVAKEISGSTWGKDLSDRGRAAVARYALETGVDAVRHIDILGSKIYLNAECYIDHAAAQPDYNGFTREYINDDPRASDEVRAKRRARRVELNTPEDPKGICVVTIHRVSKPDITEWNHAGHRRGFNAKLREHNKEEGDLIQDPIGEQDPGKTSFTRAFRRAAKLAWPMWFTKQRMAGADEEGGVDITAMGEGLEAIIQQGRDALKKHPEDAPKLAAVQPGLNVSAGGTTGVQIPADPYQPTPERRQELTDAVRNAQAPAPAPTKEEKQQADAVTTELETAKAELMKVMDHPAFSEEDRAVQRRLIGKEGVSLPKIRQWTDLYRQRVREYDEGRSD